MYKILIIALTGIFLLTGCDTPQIYPPTQKPDYTIHVVPTANNGLAALPPECPSWATSTTDPYDNQPLPQFGCASARNLALMMDQPKDLVHGRDMGDSSGVTTVGAMRRYYNNQTRGFVYPSKDIDSAVDITTAPSPASPMSGDITGGGSSSSPAPAAASGP